MRAMSRPSAALELLVLDGCTAESSTKDKAGQRDGNSPRTDSLGIVNETERVYIEQGRNEDQNKELWGECQKERGRRLRELRNR